MLTSIIVTGVISGALAYALRPGRHGEMIMHRPYNNRYDDVADPLTTQAPRFPRLPGTLRGKELFIKLSYLLRF